MTIIWLTCLHDHKGSPLHPFIHEKEAGKSMDFSALKSRLSVKSVVMSGVITLGVVAIIFLVLDIYRNSLLEERKQKVKGMVENAYHIAEFYHVKINKEGLPETDAKKYILQAIRDLPHDKNGYCWVNDSQALMLMHPTIPSLEGKNMYDYRDSNGKYFMREFIDMTRDHQAGFVFYTWPKPDDPKGPYYPKVSFVKSFTPWDWIIGSGVYIDDVDTAFKHAVLISGGLIAAVLLFAVFLIVTLTESMKKT
jgi:methyl-accepting chemotaxis protein